MLDCIYIYTLWTHLHTYLYVIYQQTIKGCWYKNSHLIQRVLFVYYFLSFIGDTPHYNTIYLCQLCPMYHVHSYAYLSLTLQTHEIELLQLHAWEMCIYIVPLIQCEGQNLTWSYIKLKVLYSINIFM